jgi:hypothetical protein
MAWWGWLLLLAYLPVAGLQAVWLGHAIDVFERRATKSAARDTQSSGDRRAGPTDSPPGVSPTRPR